MTKKISFCALFSALSIIISTFEFYLPIPSIPGVKLGLANCIVILILIKYGYWYALSVSIIKCFVVSMLFSGFTALLYSLSGAFFSLCVMTLLLKCKKYFSMYGISIAGAATHNFAQILVASILMQSKYIFNYLPFYCLHRYLQVLL